MKFWRNKFGMGGLFIGVTLALLMLFFQNSGIIFLSVPIVAAL